MCAAAQSHCQPQTSQLGHSIRRTVTVTARANRDTAEIVSDPSYPSSISDLRTTLCVVGLQHRSIPHRITRPSSDELHPVSRQPLADRSYTALLFHIDPLVLRYQPQYSTLYHFISRQGRQAQAQV